MGGRAWPIVWTAWLTLSRPSVGSKEIFILFLAYCQLSEALCSVAAVYGWPPSLLFFSLQVYGGLAIRCAHFIAGSSSFCACSSAARKHGPNALCCSSAELGSDAHVRSIRKINIARHIPSRPIQLKGQVWGTKFCWVEVEVFTQRHRHWLVFILSLHTAKRSREMIVGYVYQSLQFAAEVRTMLVEVSVLYRACSIAVVLADTSLTPCLSLHILHARVHSSQRPEATNCCSSNSISFCHSSSFLSALLCYRPFHAIAILLFVGHHTGSMIVFYTANTSSSQRIFFGIPQSTSVPILSTMSVQLAVQIFQWGTWGLFALVQHCPPVYCAFYAPTFGKLVSF